MKLTHLRVNHRQNPLGIDGAPEFSWRIESDRQNILQKRYRICVAEGGKQFGTVENVKAVCRASSVMMENR